MVELRRELIRAIRIHTVVVRFSSLARNLGDAIAGDIGSRLESDSAAFSMAKAPQAIQKLTSIAT